MSALLHPKVSSLESRKGQTIGYLFFCPGCGHNHVFYVLPPNEDGTGPVWKFNGDLARPSFEPSLLMRWTGPQGESVCHIFVRNGEIQFLPDCTHQLAGKVVPLQPFEL